MVKDAAALATIDLELARKAPAWNKLSREKITALVDWMVIDADPDAVRVARQRDIDRHLEVQPGDNGMAQIWVKSAPPTQRRSTPNSTTWRPPCAPTIPARGPSAAPMR